MMMAPFLTTTQKDLTSETIRIRGLVQGVGFRPTVWRLAKAHGLTGKVWNDGEGVQVKARGPRQNIEDFLAHLLRSLPPLAEIDSIERSPTNDSFPLDDFYIVDSESGNTQTGIVADAATCQECLQETLNPFSRRYRYPFTNCTHCGPRFSIVRSIPYDRANTSMSSFEMCDECSAEYLNPEDRRFHAQPIACHSCGPKVWLEDSNGDPVYLENQNFMDDVDIAGSLLQNGKILAIKGIGGFHLACDATNEEAVNRLREKKGRYKKPFALMANNLQMIERYCEMNEIEKSQLEGFASPIVLLKISGNERLPEAIAPGLKEIGFMLPYTPLHHLIFKDLKIPIVMTSGNFSEEPQCIDNEDARKRLKGIVDYFLMHDRDIVNRVDDSVLRVMNKVVKVFRRGRGLAPKFMKLLEDFEMANSILAFGGELKNTFCLIQNGQAILSQHIGDLENSSAYEDYLKNIELYTNLFEHRTIGLAIDKHPEYLSTKCGRDRSEKEQLPLLPVQHHHAHIASCMAENRISLNSDPILGVALDGLGYGDEDDLWGGEFLLADYFEIKRLGCFKPIPLLGGSLAMKEPWRNTLAHIISCIGWEKFLINFSDLEITKFLKTKPISALQTISEKNLNSPLASSVGRLFDAVAAALGICREKGFYEGQAAIELEAMADETILLDPKELGYQFSLEKDLEKDLMIIDPQLMWKELFQDLKKNISVNLISSRFHKGLAHAIGAMIKRLTYENKEKTFHTVALSGGVFQNCILLEHVTQILQRMNLKVLTHNFVPANDGGISLGQAVVAAAQLLRREQ